MTSDIQTAPLKLAQTLPGLFDTRIPFSRAVGKLVDVSLRFIGDDVVETLNDGKGGVGAEGALPGVRARSHKMRDSVNIITSEVFTQPYRVF